MERNRFECIKSSQFCANSSMFAVCIFSTSWFIFSVVFHPAQYLRTSFSMSQYRRRFARICLLLSRQLILKAKWFSHVNDECVLVRKCGRWKAMKLSWRSKWKTLKQVCVRFPCNHNTLAWRKFPNRKAKPLMSSICSSVHLCTF